MLEMDEVEAIHATEEAEAVQEADGEEVQFNKNNKIRICYISYVYNKNWHKMALDEEEANLIQIALDLQYRQRQQLATEVASSKWVFSRSKRLDALKRFKKYRPIQ